MRRLSLAFALLVPPVSVSGNPPLLDLCIPGERDDCVRLVRFIEGAPVTVFRPLESVRTCESANGVYFGSAADRERYGFQPGAAELIGLFQGRIFPAIVEAFRREKMEVNGQTCNVAAALTLSALRMMGVIGARLVEGGEHVFVEVETRDGKPVVLDPTAAQFVRDGTEVDRSLRARGFAGTYDELFSMVETNVEHWSFSPPEVIEPLTLSCARGGACDSDVTPADARGVVREAAERAMRTYADDGIYHGLRDAAERQVAFHASHDPSEKYMAFIFPSGWADRTAQTRRLYRSLEERLGGR